MNVQPLRIIHPTDFSQTSLRAFWHALKLALATRGDLMLLHLENHEIDKPHWSDFPHVRETLQAWGLLAPGAHRTEVSEKLGIKVAKFEIENQSLTHGIESFTQQYGGDLLVMGTEGRSGWSNLVSGSRAQAIMHSTKLSTLFIPAQSGGFVDGKTGLVTLNRILAPVDHQPSPELAIRELLRLIGPLGLPSNSLSLIHVGEDAPLIRFGKQEGAAPVECLDGPVTQAILDAADRLDADMITMVTAGHHGVFDALRGSTTEQVIRNARRPVLAIPAR